MTENTSLFITLKRI